MKKVFSLIVMTLLLVGCGSKYQTIDSNEAKILIDEGAIVIDVREIDEFNTGHINGALNVPLGQISEIEYDVDSVIILYCASGMRSMEAAKILADMGYTSIYNLDGGLLNWGFELEE